MLLGLISFVSSVSRLATTSCLQRVFACGPADCDWDNDDEEEIVPSRAIPSLPVNSHRLISFGRESQLGESAYQLRVAGLTVAGEHEAPVLDDLELVIVRILAGENERFNFIRIVIGADVDPRAADGETSLDRLFCESLGVKVNLHKVGGGCLEGNATNVEQQVGAAEL